jgi:hypothetical protein
LPTNRKYINLNAMKRNTILVFLAFLSTLEALSQGTIIDHTSTRIAQIPESVILAARQNLHIAYGHTSHGSQLTDGMTGMVTFMNGLGFTNNLYAWNNGGTSGALDLHDYAMGGDVGYYPDWVNNTRDYLGTPNLSTGRGTGANDNVNVIIWSWCGQVDDKYAAGTLYSEYINPMAQLETDYPGIKFIYMTGHLDHSDDANNKAANQAIRNYCISNNKILYDFADIESYNPDNTFFQYAGDDCSYYSANGTLLGNWAIEWQNSHTINVDWYDCSSAHSQALNANQKAYAAWWLWARLTGWVYSPTGINEEEQNTINVSVFPNPSDGRFTVKTTNYNIDAIEIFNIIGSKVASRLYSEQPASAEVDISGLVKGIYILKVKNGKKTYVEKILIK